MENVRAAGTSQRDLPMLVGFALFQMWVTLCFFTPQLFPAAEGDNRVYELSLAVSAVALVLGAVFHRRLAPYLQDDRMVWVLAGAAALGTALVPFCFGVWAPAKALTVVAGILTGVASGLLNVAWCRAFVKRGNAVDFTLSVVTSSLLIYVVTNVAYAPTVSPLVILTVSVLTPLVSAALLCRGAKMLAPKTSPMAVPVDMGPSQHYLVRLCLGIFLISMCDEFMRNYYLAGTDLSFYSSQVNLIVLVFKVVVSAAVMGAILRMQRGSFALMYRGSFLLALVAALLLPFGDVLGSVGYAVTNAGAFLFKLVILLVALEFCARGASATLTLCLIRAVWSLDLLAGFWFCEVSGAAFGGAGVEPTVLTAILAVLVAVAYLVVFSPDRPDSAPEEAVEAAMNEIAGNGGNVTMAASGEAGEGGEEPGGAGLFGAGNYGAGACGSGTRGAGTCGTGTCGSGTEALADLDAVCDWVAQAGGLSPRESDVLRLLARGRSTARIQEELGISVNTANTHIKHIFTKLGVHSRQELLDICERRRA